MVVPLPIKTLEPINGTRLNHHPNLTQSLTQSPKTHTKLRMTKPSIRRLLGCPQYAEISWIAATKGIVKSAT
ncbi:hypothetical protein JSHR31_07390 [Helicobacter pylori]|nr:hypothetical protein JSHR31_07390 [Helicobacter pylori]GHR36004.1 hypothetical protein JP0096_11300 [Helicobacter pylori]